MSTPPKPYTAVRLALQKGKDEYDRHFTVAWDTAVSVVDPTRLSQFVPAVPGEVWALWDTETGPGWYVYATTHLPVFLLILATDGEPLMLSDLHAGDIRELSVNQEED